MSFKTFIKSKNVGEYLQSRKDKDLKSEIEGRSAKTVLKNAVKNEKEKSDMGFMDNVKAQMNAQSGKQYVVLQVTLKETFLGTGSKNLTELEDVINQQASYGYRLHTISTAAGGSKGLGGGDRIQATMVFEKIG